MGNDLVQATHRKGIRKGSKRVDFSMDLVDFGLFPQVLIKEDLFKADFTFELELPLLATLSGAECLAALQQGAVFGADGRCLEASEVQELLAEAQVSLEELSALVRPLLEPLRQPLQGLRARGEQAELAADVQAQLRALGQSELPTRWRLGAAQLRERQGEEAQRGQASDGVTACEVGFWASSWHRRRRRPSCS